MGKILPKDLALSVPIPRKICEELDRYVIGQDRAKRTLAIAAYNHYKRISDRPNPALGETEVPLKKSNLLLIGPSGCGKTHLARTLSRILEVPFVVADATEYTEAGYYGKDVEVMLGELLYAADLDVDRAQQGIVFIDEIDKIARRNQGERTGAGGRDIGGEGVQQSLLKILEGMTVFVPYNITQHWNKHDFVQMDSSNILFICAGTFTDMKKGRHRRISGFQKAAPEVSGVPVEQRVQVEDLMEYGLIAEFVGRLPVIVELEELSESQLVKIMTDPPDSILREYTRLFAMDGLELTVEPEALAAVAAYAKRRKLGARSLRTSFEDLMHDHMFEAPERPGEKIVITRDEVQKKLR